MNILSLKKESFFELNLALREPAFIIPTLIFPLMFYVFFGLLFSQGGQMPTHLMVTYGVFGIMGPSLFGFGANIASDRDKGWLAIKYVSPMPPLQLILAKLFNAAIFASAVIFGLFILGAALGGVALEKSQWLSIAGLLILGTIPFCALGLAVGLWVKGSAAVAILNLIFIPSAILSGLWFPISIFPQWLQGVANFLPPYHLSQLGLKIINLDQGQSVFGHIAGLLIATAIFLFIAVIGYQKNRSE